MTNEDARRLLDRLAELSDKCRPDEPWDIEREPHDYADGTTHFTHVRQIAHLQGEAVRVLIASHVTPDLAELLVLMRNNLPALIGLARRGLSGERF